MASAQSSVNTPIHIDLALPEALVLIIVTGGTICMKKSDRGLVPAPSFLKFGLAPRPCFNDGTYPEPLEIIINDNGKRKAVQSLRTPISSYGRSVRYAVFEFEKLLDSSSIDAAGWDQIARAVLWNYQLFDGFVILHGTDSLAYTASALSFMLQNLGKPVILTGSQASIMELQNDAEANLLNSLIMAGHFMIPEVCLLFNAKLFRGNRATKVSAEDFDAFGSPNCPPLGTITSTRTRIRWDIIHRPKSMNPFSIQTGLNTTHVACLRIFPGIKPEMVDAVLKLEGLKGLVLETFGAGNTPGNADSALNRILIDAVKRGVVIVNVTQCLSGSANAIYEAGTALARAGIVFGNDMTSESALTKLSYLLSLQNSTAEEVTRNMSLSLRGELSDAPQTHFHHPGGSGALTPERSTLSALHYAIREGDLEGVREIVRTDSRFLLNDGDYSGNTPLVSWAFHHSQGDLRYHLQKAAGDPIKGLRKLVHFETTFAPQPSDSSLQHIASTSPNVGILKEFLVHGASVHIRNREGHTPLFLAANAGLKEHVEALREAGAHLHLDEIAAARLQATTNGDANKAWALAGTDMLS